MAGIDDLLKGGNVVTTLAIGAGAILLAPMAGQVLRPAAKKLIKGGMLAYQGLAELGEMASDIVAEAHAEIVVQNLEAEAALPHQRGEGAQGSRSKARIREASNCRSEGQQRHPLDCCGARLMAGR